MNKQIMDLHKLCIEDKIPIMREQTVKNLSDIICSYPDCQILEIGTAYGYSTLLLADLQQCRKIISLEKNTHNYDISKQYCGHKGNILLINTCCFEYIPTQKFDVIIFDGPKSNQDKLFDKYSPFLNTNGVIFIDNIELKKFNNAEFLTKNQKNLIKKVKDFKIFLQEIKNNEWKIEFYDIDDGYAIARRK